MSGDDKYKGRVGPADAMSALSYEAAYAAAYIKATDALMDTVLEFERITGRIVDSIEISTVDVTTIQDVEKRTIRHAFLRFLPRHDEVA